MRNLTSMLTSHQSSVLQPAREQMDTRCVCTEMLGCKDSAGGSAGPDSGQGSQTARTPKMSTHIHTHTHTHRSAVQYIRFSYANAFSHQRIQNTAADMESYVALLVLKAYCCGCRLAGTLSLTCWRTSLSEHFIRMGLSATWQKSLKLHTADSLGTGPIVAVSKQAGGDSLFWEWYVSNVSDNISLLLGTCLQNMAYHMSHMT